MVALNLWLLDFRDTDKKYWELNLIESIHCQEREAYRSCYTESLEIYADVLLLVTLLQSFTNTVMFKTFESVWVSSCTIGMLFFSLFLCQLRVTLIHAVVLL